MYTHTHIRLRKPKILTCLTKNKRIMHLRRAVTIFASSRWSICDDMLTPYSYSHICENGKQGKSLGKQIVNYHSAEHAHTHTRSGKLMRECHTIRVYVVYI